MRLEKSAAEGGFWLGASRRLVVGEICTTFESLA
jgi:hypothetical protein